MDHPHLEVAMAELKLQYIGWEAMKATAVERAVHGIKEVSKQCSPDLIRFESDAPTLLVRTPYVHA